MANRHKAQKKASGGRTYYSGGSSNVAKEAAQTRKAGGKVGGAKTKPSFKARGGRTGSNNNPFSSAKIKEKGNLTC